jgi:hypothetical protein
MDLTVVWHSQSRDSCRDPYNYENADCSKWIGPKIDTVTGVIGHLAWSDADYYYGHLASK